MRQDGDGGVFRGKGLAVAREREAGKVGRTTMQRFICPECGVEAELTPRYGGEIVSVYCLKHKSGVDRHVHPILMTAVPIPAPVVELEPVPA